MKTKIYRLLLMILLSVFLMSCGSGKEDALAKEEKLSDAAEEESAEEQNLKGTAEPIRNAEDTTRTESNASEKILNRPQFSQYADTYWTAVAYQRELKTDEGDDGGEWMELPVAAAENRRSWWMDLFFFADGTVRLRDVSGDFYSGMAMAGRWKESADGLPVITESSYLHGGTQVAEEISSEEIPVFVSDLLMEPEKSLKETSLIMEYYDGYIYFQQADMPDADGRLCIADLRGDWSMVSGRGDGFTYDARKEGIISALSFEEGRYATEAVYVRYTKLFHDFYDFRATLRYREEPLYNGCGNENWSVELAPQTVESLEDKWYVTLTDLDTLLMQQFYTVDGINFVDYQTYRRSSESEEAITLQRQLDTVLATCPSDTLVSVGADMYSPEDAGLQTLMEVVRLTEQKEAGTLLLLCPAYVKLQILWNSEVIHETELWEGESELLILELPKEQGTCQINLTADEESWYLLDLSRELFNEPKWMNVLNPASYSQ